MIHCSDNNAGALGLHASQNRNSYCDYLCCLDSRSHQCSVQLATQLLILKFSELSTCTSWSLGYFTKGSHLSSVRCCLDLRSHQMQPHYCPASYIYFFNEISIHFIGFHPQISVWGGSGCGSFTHRVPPISHWHQLHVLRASMRELNTKFNNWYSIENIIHTIFLIITSTSTCIVFINKKTKSEALIIRDK